MVLRLIAAMAMIVIGVAPASAQVANPNLDPTIPYGSPTGNQTDQSRTQSRDNSSNTSPDTSGSRDTRLEPTNIDESRRSTREDEPLDSRNEPRLNDVVTPNARLKPLIPSEFERYVERTLGRKLPRFGANLLLPSNRDYAVPATATVPSDYILNVGDTVAISLTGSVEGSVDVEIDTDGKIFLPKVGSITLTGVRYRDLRDTIGRAVGRQYRGYTVTVAVKQLRGIRVYVTGFANNPGAYSVNSLSTLTNAVLAAGGPSSGGSFRSAILYRNGRLVSNFDLYDLILHGDRSKDAILQNEDVVFIPPLGQQVAVTGSVNAEAVYETRADESVETLLSYAGGPNDLADPTRVMLFRLADLDTVSGKEIARADAGATAVAGGDILQILSQGSLQRPLERQAVLVRVEGEVNAPGNYFVAPNTSLGEIMAKAGGFTPRAFVYGTRIERLSVKRQQRESFAEAIEQLEITLAASPLTGSQLNPADRDAQQTSAKAVLERLRQAEPDGRVVLDLAAEAMTLPTELILENNDRIIIPPRAVTVGVFGAVYRPASFLINGAKTLRVRDYIDRAGGALRSGDKGGIFVVRANGDVVSRRRGALKAAALPGDVIFVPVKTESTSIWVKIREISTIIFQLGIGGAAFVAVAR